MDFPRMVHKPDDRLIVTNQVDLDAALAAGWVLSRRVFDAVAAAVPVEAPVAAPTPVETPLAHVPVKRGPGRPRKVKE